LFEAKDCSFLVDGNGCCHPFLQAAHYVRISVFMVKSRTDQVVEKASEKLRSANLIVYIFSLGEIDFNWQ
jgi:hypothetical protein